MTYIYLYLLINAHLYPKGVEGIHNTEKNASNMAVTYELGRLPVEHLITQHIVIFR